MNDDNLSCGKVLQQRQSTNLYADDLFFYV